jgi:hypothetical protein
MSEKVPDTFSAPLFRPAAVAAIARPDVLHGMHLSSAPLRLAFFKSPNRLPNSILCSSNRLLCQIQMPSPSPSFFFVASLIPLFFVTHSAFLSFVVPC